MGEFLKLIKQTVCKHLWDIDYMTGRAVCKKCDKISKKNYYTRTVREKF